MTSLKIRLLWPDGRKRRYLLRLTEVGAIRVIGPEHLNAPIAFTVAFENGKGWIRPGSQQDSLFEAVDPATHGRPWREHRELPLAVGAEFYLRAGADYFGVQILEVPDLPQTQDIRQLVHPPQSRPQAPLRSDSSLPAPLELESPVESLELPAQDPWKSRISNWAKSQRRPLTLGLGGLVLVLLILQIFDFKSAIRPTPTSSTSPTTSVASPQTETAPPAVTQPATAAAHEDSAEAPPAAPPPPTLSVEQIFFSALDQGDQARVRDMLQAKAIEVDEAKRDGYAALHIAAARGDVGMVKVLIAQGADPNVLDAQGSTALMWAVFRRHLPVVRYLAPKSNLQIMRSSGERAVDLARRLQYPELVSLIDPDLAAPKVAAPPRSTQKDLETQSRTKADANDRAKRPPSSSSASRSKSNKDRRPTSLPAKKPSGR
ncbi:MAG TPA: ankyrin repeat domain-containing protein [Pseudobdellovibrionaceae bacterium]|nr:ankyrin repeat domain-containing protein [Pseudobdellovibrionaceae bacterium]